MRILCGLKSYAEYKALILDFSYLLRSGLFLLSPAMTSSGLLLCSPVSLSDGKHGSDYIPLPVSQRLCQIDPQQLKIALCVWWGRPLQSCTHQTVTWISLAIIFTSYIKISFSCANANAHCEALKKKIQGVTTSLEI